MLTGIFSLSLVTEAIYASPRIDDAQETRFPKAIAAKETGMKEMGIMAERDNNRLSDGL
jgi:hypothetical protein